MIHFGNKNIERNVMCMPIMRASNIPLTPAPARSQRNPFFIEFSFQILWKFKLSYPWLSTLLTWFWLSTRAWLHLFLKYLANTTVCLIPTTPSIPILLQRFIIILTHHEVKGIDTEHSSMLLQYPFHFFKQNDPQPLINKCYVPVRKKLPGSNLSDGIFYHNKQNTSERLSLLLSFPLPIYKINIYWFGH